MGSVTYIVALGIVASPTNHLVTELCFMLAEHRGCADINTSRLGDV